jgi:amidohydrolase
MQTLTDVCPFSTTLNVSSHTRTREQTGMGMKEQAERSFAAVQAELHDISQWMYDNPEIAYQEFNTSARLASFLTDNGFEVDYPAWGLETSFNAVSGTSGPEVIICAEYDALPEVGHACGHNIIATAALGAGAALVPLAEELGIRIRILGTPAEEEGGGKVDLIEAGAFAGAAAAMMIHPAPFDVVDKNYLAVAHIDIGFSGKESHAALAPQLGINALDAAVQAYNNISMLRQTLFPTDKVHGVITYGGGVPNVIPAFTSMSWYVRAATKARLDELYSQAMACFEAAATATRCTLEVRPRGHAYTDLRADPVIVELYAQNSAALGRPMGRGADEDPGAAGSTDMGNVSYELPTIHPMLDIHPAGAVNHQKAFAAHTMTPAGQAVIRDGALSMAYTVIDLAEGNRWDELGQ